MIRRFRLKREILYKGTTVLPGTEFIADADYLFESEDKTERGISKESKLPPRCKKLGRIILGYIDELSDAKFPAELVESNPDYFEEIDEEGKP